MKNSLYLLCLAATLVLTSHGYTQDLDIQQLVGEWKVDLRPTPDAEGYFQKLIITKADENGIEGTFYYHSEILESAVNLDWNLLAFAFVTRDNSGFYNSTARLINGRLKGTTHSVERDFLAIWSAEKVN